MGMAQQKFVVFDPFKTSSITLKCESCGHLDLYGTNNTMQTRKACPKCKSGIMSFNDPNKAQRNNASVSNQGQQKSLNQKQQFNQQQAYKQPHQQQYNQNTQPQYNNNQYRPPQQQQQQQRYQQNNYNQQQPQQYNPNNQRR